MDHRVTADWMTLMRQASMTADTFFGAALATVDKFLAEDGDHYSAPERFSMAMDLANLAKEDFKTSSFVVAAQNIADAILAAE